MSQHVLLIANETVDEELADELFADGDDTTEVLVVAPALSGRLELWTNDDRQARRIAKVRLDDTLATLRASGIDASGWVGGDDPLVAMEDALRVFDADRIVLVTYPPWASNWLERKLVRRAAARTCLPVRHAVAGALQAAA